MKQCNNLAKKWHYYSAFTLFLEISLLYITTTSWIISNILIGWSERGGCYWPRWIYEKHPRDLHNSSDQTKSKYKIVLLFTSKNSYYRYKNMLALNNTFGNCRRPALLQLFCSASWSRWLQHCNSAAHFVWVVQCILKTIIKRVPYRVFQSCNPDPKLCVIP